MVAYAKPRPTCRMFFVCDMDSLGGKSQALVLTKSFLCVVGSWDQKGSWHPQLIPWHCSFAQA